jgi:hypothetical protein
LIVSLFFTHDHYTDHWNKSYYVPIDLGQTILWETKRHEEDMDVLSTKLRGLQSELSTIVHEKSVVETKLIELDQLVGQLLSGKAICLV